MIVNPFKNQYLDLPILGRMVDGKRDASYTSLHSINIEIWANIVLCYFRARMFSLKPIAIGSHCF